MSLPVWPAALPQQMLREGYTQDEANNAIHSDPELGPSLSRRRTTVNSGKVSGQFYMTTSEYETVLLPFFRNTLKEVLPFSLPKPAAESGTITVKFKSPPNRRPAKAPGRWVVTVDFEWIV